MIRRTSSGNAKNGITSDQFRRQDWAMAGYFLPHAPSAKSSRASLPGIGVLCLVDLLQCRGNRLAILVRDEGQRVADEMDDTSLHLRQRKDGGDRFREALQAIDDGDQHVLDAAALQLVH